jgi:hypothetical protein
MSMLLLDGTRKSDPGEALVVAPTGGVITARVLVDHAAGPGATSRPQRRHEQLNNGPWLAGPVSAVGAAGNAPFAELARDIAAKGAPLFLGRAAGWVRAQVGASTQ